jgi:Zn-dependent peptidase ImmA (M78 family)
MPRGTLVPITPSVLEWALKESGYSPEVAAQKIKVSAGALQAWLQGAAEPRLTEFRKLAALLKRTPATFLLPRPPENEPLAIEFRRAPGSDRTGLNPSERLYLRESRRLHELLMWVEGELGESTEPLPQYRTETSPEDVAAIVSSSLLPARPQSGFKTASHAFNWWRRGLESLGVLVFTFPLGREGVRGFSVWHDRSPVVAVNTWWRVEARTFTLFHEFGHLLTRTASACLEAGRHFARPSDAVERWCEQFSAAIVLPKLAVEKFLAEDLGRPAGLKVDNLEVPSLVAGRFRVSLRAATLRLIEMRLATWDLYSRIPPVSDNKPPGGGGRGRDRADIREGQYGDRAVSLMVNALNRDVLGRTDVLDALNISDADLSKLERKAARSA